MKYILTIIMLLTFSTANAEEVTKKLTITGERAVVEAGIVTVAKQNGWTETIVNDEGLEIPNPMTAEEMTLQVIKVFLRQTIESYNVTQAVRQAAEAASTASKAALDTLSLGLIEE